MKRFETWKTWAFILGILLFSAVATVAWPWIQSQISGDFEWEGVYASPAIEGLAVESGEPITIQLEDYLLGEVLVEAPLLSELNGVEVSPLLLSGIIALVVFGALFAVALPLAFIYVQLDRQTTALKQDESFQAKRVELEKRQQEGIKALAESQPPGPIPEHERTGWSIVTTSAVVLMFVVFVGFALADTLYPEGEVQFYSDALVNPALPLTGVLVLIALLGLIAYFRPRRAEALPAAEDDDGAIPWDTIWVVVSGLIFLGIGIGLMFAVRSMASG